MPLQKYAYHMSLHKYIYHISLHKYIYHILPHIYIYRILSQKCTCVKINISSSKGMLNTISEVVSSASVLMSLWKHEATRVIADRFTEHNDKVWFENALKQVSFDENGDVGKVYEYVQITCAVLLISSGLMLSWTAKMTLEDDDVFNLALTDCIELYLFYWGVVVF